MHYVITVNDNFVLFDFNRRNKYTRTAKLVSDIRLSTVFCDIQSAAQRFTEYLDELREVIDDPENVVVRIQAVDISLGKENITMPNLFNI